MLTILLSNYRSMTFYLWLIEMTYDKEVFCISSCYFSPSQYYPVNRMVSADYCGYPGGPQYVEEFPIYPSGVRPDSICSVSAVGGYDKGWTAEQRHPLRDGPHQLYAHLMPRDPWEAQYYGGMETSMRRLSIQPRSRSVPRSSSSTSGGPYSPVPPNFASPARSSSARFPGKVRDDVIYADPSIYSLRRSLGSPKVSECVCGFICTERVVIVMRESLCLSCSLKKTIVYYFI